MRSTIIDVLTTAGVRALNKKPERGRGAKGPLRERALLSLIYKVSPRETRGRFCGGTSLPHNKKSALQGLGRTRPRPRQRRPHQRRRLPVFIF